jgi:hypothetical protein
MFFLNMMRKDDAESERSARISNRRMLSYDQMSTLFGKGISLASFLWFGIPGKLFF